VTDADLERVKRELRYARQHVARLPEWKKETLRRSWYAEHIYWQNQGTGGCWCPDCKPHWHTTP
jgi:hypothetical protein